jgi:hypothetical protein
MGANRPPPGGVECRLGSSIIKTASPKAGYLGISSRDPSSRCQSSPMMILPVCKRANFQLGVKRMCHGTYDSCCRSYRIMMTFSFCINGLQQPISFVSPSVPAIDPVFFPLLHPKMSDVTVTSTHIRTCGIESQLRAARGLPSRHATASAGGAGSTVPAGDVRDRARIPLCHYE